MLIRRHGRHRRLAGLGAALVLAGCCGISGAANAAGAAYGEQFVRVGHQWPDGGPGFEHAMGAGGRERAQPEYQRQIAARELEGGPYDDGLAEPLAAMAAYHRSAGDFDLAVRFYRRALHVVRINDGLYSERQTPILRELLNTFRSAGDLDALDRRYDYFFRLLGGGQPPYTEARLRATVEYLRWQREAVRLGLGGDDDKRLLALHDLNESILQAAGGDPQVDPSWYRELGLSQLRNLYLIYSRLAPAPENMGMAPSTPLLASDWTEEDVNTHRLESIRRGALGRGERLLLELMERAGDADAESRASLQLELGDWYQWHGRDQQAEQQYAAVGSLLRMSGREETLHEWLGQPVELPDNGAFWQPTAAGEPRRRVVVNASYDVSAQGRVSNIDAATAREQDADVVRSLRRKLARTRFRPRFVNGEPEQVAGLTREYELID
jgi:hypothetical protein